MIQQVVKIRKTKGKSATVIHRDGYIVKNGPVSYRTKKILIIFNTKRRIDITQIFQVEEY